MNRDTAHANEQLDRPDEKALLERIDLIQSTVQLGQSVIETVAAAKRKDAEEQRKKATTEAEKVAATAAVEDANAWSVGGDKRLLADVATGLIAAGLGGAGGATGVGILANTTSADTYQAIGNYADRQSRLAQDETTRAAWAEGGSARALMHALAGALQGLSSGNALAGASGAAASEMLMPVIDKALADSGYSATDRASLTTLIAAGVGAGAAAATNGGTAAQAVGAKTATGVDLYNRKLHQQQEVAVLKQKAEELKATVALKSDVSWEDLLLLAGGAAVDAKDQQRLLGILRMADGNDPESLNFLADFDQAMKVINDLAAQRIPLTWANGQPIIADGKPVYAFSATEEQFNDSGLFDATTLYGQGAIYDQWRRFGQAQTAAHSSELSGASSYPSLVEGAAERATGPAMKGINTIAPELDALMVIAPGLRGRSLLLTR